MDKGWICGCGKCDTNFFLRNGKLTAEGDFCDQCRDWLTDENGPLVEYLNDMVVTELGWCGCGSPEKVDKMMLEYLQSLDDEYEPWSDHKLLLAYIADDQKWTEHGGSVYGAWLTDKGKEFLANLQEAKKWNK